MDLKRVGSKSSQVLIYASLMVSSGCTTGADTTELASVQSTAASYKAAVNALNNPVDTRHDVDHLHMAHLVLTNMTVYIDELCYKEFTDKFETYASSLNQRQASQDQAYKAMIQAAVPCSKLVNPPPVAGAAPVDPGSAALDVAKAAGSAKSTPNTQHVAKALQDYFANLQVIVTASSTDDIKAAASTLDASTAALAKAVNAPAQTATGLDLVNKLASVALDELQYETLRKYVLEMDPLLEKAAPVMVVSLRLTQGENIEFAAGNASGAATWLNRIINKDLETQPAQRYAVYESLAPSLDDANATLVALARNDPAAVVNDLVKAHHDLALVLKSNKHQTKGAVRAVSAIAQDGKSIVDASNK